VRIHQIVPNCLAQAAFLVNAMASNVNFLSGLYPDYRILIRQSVTLSLKARSLVVKACQAQSWPVDPNSTLYKLMDPIKIILYLGPRNQLCLPLLDYAPHYRFEFDELTSTILLDIMRGLEVPEFERKEAVLASWAKEICLSESKKRESAIRWDYIFDFQAPLDEPIDVAGLLPSNPTSLRMIRNRLQVFKRRYSKTIRILHARATHKNMSRGTRRDFERKTDIDLEGVAIFGQDDWQRYRARTGDDLEGYCEIRQKWYPSGTKPRSYFTQGGVAYKHSRFLQTFFTQLVNGFPSTNHISRLQPHRLAGNMDRENPAYLVYDLSNFTSNMSEQQYFVWELAKFFLGVIVIVLDEWDGYIYRDLGELLFEYHAYCVDEPELTYERFDPLREDPIRHGIASLLGIFGNLMTCTLAHWIIISPTCDEDEANVAGDDGLKPEDVLDNYESRLSISYVGDFAPDKVYRQDSHAVCLKRPFTDSYPTCFLGLSIIPPTAVTAMAILQGEQFHDPRYIRIFDSSMTHRKKINVIGKDMMRFLRSCFEAGYQDSSLVYSVWRGYGNAIKSYIPDFDPNEPTLSPIWPVSPAGYEFTEHDPIAVLVVRARGIVQRIPVREELSDDPTVERKSGEVFECNLSPRLSLLRRLGYIEEETVEYDPTEQEAVRYWVDKLSKKKGLVNKLSRFTVAVDIPDRFMLPS